MFLDANVLFSAAYRPGAGLLRLWAMEDVRLLSSGYAVAEARRNLHTPERRARLAQLLNGVSVPATAYRPVRALSLDLPAKDMPILRAAIALRCGFLLTGDKTHFGPFYGRHIRGVLILPPLAYPRLAAP